MRHVCQSLSDFRGILFRVTNEAFYSYDIDQQRLPLVGGDLKSPDYREYKQTSLVPLSIHRKLYGKETCEASNSFGKTVVVTKGYFNDYFLHLTNHKSLPAALNVPGKNSNAKNEQLALSVAIRQDQAKQLAPRLSRLRCQIRCLHQERE